MAVVINGQTGIDAGHLPISNAGNTEVEGILTTQGQNVSPFSGFKNYIINGNFSIWQRGTSSSSVGYAADRWHLGIGGSAVAMKHNVEPNTILVSTTAASSFVNLYQAIETATVIGLRGKTLTLSLKLQTGGTHTGGFVLSARYSNSTDTLNSQTTTIRSLGISVSSANTRYSLTFTVPADAVGLRIDIENTSVQPSGALYQVQEVQLEEGSVATPFEQRQYGLELSLCQRYYESSYSNGVTVGSASTLGAKFTIVVSSATAQGFTFIEPKRVPPTIAIYSPSGTAGYVWNSVDIDNGSATPNNIGTKGVRYLNNAINNWTANSSITYHYTASAEL